MTRRADLTIAVDGFADRVLSVVERIPAGHVMSYGDLAEYLGEGGPRQVGRVMAMWGGGVAWWRVIYSDGSPPPCHEGAAYQHYLAEGTPLRSPGPAVRVDMRRARWSGNDPARGSPGRPAGGLADGPAGRSPGGLADGPAGRSPGGLAAERAGARACLDA